MGGIMIFSQVLGVVILFLLFNLVEPTDRPVETHACFRECLSDPKTRKTCGYNFTLEYFWILSKACYECPNVTKDCSRFDCISADGVKRAISVVNRLLPGPAIRVCEGDTVVVDIKNQLFGEGTAIHWHGIHQKKTPWMDGVPGITQCTIPMGSTFRYEFETPLGGSYFWHSHAGFQRGDGLFGSLVVRKPLVSEPHNHFYDYDLPEHEILIWDWLDQLTMSAFLNHHHSDGDNKPRGILINGKGLPLGFFKDIPTTKTIQSSGKRYVPIHEVRIKKGKSYRMRLISNGILNCPLEISIENHTMQVINSDGLDLEPIMVTSLVIYASERWDIVVRGNQPASSYWIKVRGLMDCDDRFTSVYQVAVLNYETQLPGVLPKHSIRNWHEAGSPKDGIQVNSLNIAPSSGHYMTVADLSSLKDDDPEIITKEKADHQFYLGYDFNPIDNIHFQGPHISIRTVRKGAKLQTPQINFISHVMPHIPILTQPDSMNKFHFCNESSMKVNCSVEYCECTHLIKVKLNSIVELVLVDRGHTFDANHPFHLHGYSFRVIAMERLANSTEPYIIQERDNKGLINRRRSNAPIKDSVTVPDGGYTMIRFRANNPGFWFLHCHIEFHMEIGMGLIIQVGDRGDMLVPPADFPKCDSYIPPVHRTPIWVDETPLIFVFRNDSSKSLAHSEIDVGSAIFRKKKDVPISTFSQLSKRNISSVSTSKSKPSVPPIVLNSQKEILSQRSKRNISSASTLKRKPSVPHILNTQTESLPPLSQLSKRKISSVSTLKRKPSISYTHNNNQTEILSPSPSQVSKRQTVVSYNGH